MEDFKITQVPLIRLLILIGCFLLGGILSAIFIAGLSPLLGVANLQEVMAQISQGAFTEQVNVVKVLLMVSHIFLFAIPAIIYGFVIYKRGWTKQFYLSKKPKWSLMGLSFFLVFFSLPIVLWIYYFSMELIPSDSTAEQTRALQAALLNMDGPTDLILNLILVGVLAGVGEELLFRGGMQKILAEMFKNTHIAIWVTAIIFSAIHGELQGFIPRLIMGAVFGYVLTRTGSLWIPIVMHIFFNSTQVVATYLSQDIDPAEATTPPILWTIIFTVIFGGFLWLFLRLSKNTIITKDEYIAIA